MLSTRKSKSLWWILGVLLCLLAFSAARPSSPGPALPTANNATDNSTSETRDDKVNQPAIGESIKMVANQLLQSNKTPPPNSSDGGIVEDIRTPPKMKNQQINKSKTPKPSPYTAKPQIIIENSNAGVAVPIVDTAHSSDSTKNASATSTSSEGLSTWVLLSEGPTTSMPKVSTPKSNVVLVDDKSKSDTDSSEMKKPQLNKPKPKPTPKPARATTTAAPKPIFNRKPVAIVSANKSDLIASGSAVNENVMNKIKASVLANVQKNKAAALNKTTSKVTTTTTSTSTMAPAVLTPSTQAVTETSKITVEPTTKKVIPPKLEKVEISTKKPKLNNKNKNKENEVLENKRKEIEIEVVSSNASLESKEAEIELEVSTPAPSTTKKPKRKTTSKKKKNKNRRRKPIQESESTKTEVENTVESKITPSNNTKAAQKISSKEKPITTQLYNYFSREVMPSVGVGLVSLAGIVGLASYFLYPFSSVVRRAYDTNDRKDDIYQQNGELYATADGGQTEEEMLGTFFPDVPESNKKINPYAGQTQFHYPQKKQQEQNIRYRNVAYGSEANSFVPSNRVGQHSVDTIHGAAYSEPIHYDTHVPKHSDPYTVYPQGQPVYSPNVQDSPDNTYVTDSVQASYMTQDGGSDPAYNQAYNYGQQEFDYNKQPDPQAPVAEALHMGVEDVIEHQKETGYTVAPSDSDDNKHPFVVGNVPKELIQAVTPVTVPEHGPRGFRLKREVRAEQYVGIPNVKNLGDALENAFNEARKEDKNHDYSNEIDEALGLSTRDYSKAPSQDETSDVIHLLSGTTTLKPDPKDRMKVDKKKKVPENHTDKKNSVTSKTTISLPEKPLTNEVNTISIINENSATTKSSIVELQEATKKNEENIVIVSTTKFPIVELQESTKKTEENMIIVVATKMDDPSESVTIKTKLRESESDPLSASTIAPPERTTSGFSSAEVSTSKDYISTTTYNYEDQTYTEEMYPDTYPPVYYEPKPFSILGLIRNLIEFKVRLGLGIIQSTTETIARYLRGVESNVSYAAKASANVHHHYHQQKE